MKNIIQLIKKNYLIDGAILFLLMILFFSRWIFFDHFLLFASDIIQDFATHRFAAFSWGNGQVPLWDPYFFWASIGYFNSGFFYPFNFLVDLLFIFTYQDLNLSFLLMQFNIFFHFFLASFFMYLLVRQFTSSRLTAIISGIIFAYSGYMVKGYLHYNYVQANVWLPLVFLFFYKSVFSGKNWLFSVLAGIVLTISLLPGQTQPGIYYLFLLFIFAFYAAYFFWQTKEGSLKKPFISLAIVLLVTIGLFAIQLLPTYEYKKFTPRESMEYSYSIGYSVDPLYFIFHTFIPTFWGTMQSNFWNGLSPETLPSNDQPKWLDLFFGGLPNEMTFYLGLLPFFLLPFAAFSKNQFLRNLLFILLFASILLMMARSIPLIGRLYWMILGGIARVPARAAILFSFSLAFLSALGLEAILNLKEIKKELFDKIIRTYFIIFFALVFVFLPLLVSLLLLQAGRPLFVYFLFPIINGFSLFLIYFLIYSFLLFCLIKLKDKMLIVFLILIFTVIDIFSFHMNNTYLTGDLPERTLGLTGFPEINILKNDQDYFRVQGMKMGAYANNLYSLGYGTTGSFGFAYRPMTELYNIIPDYGSPIYDLLNVKYFYAPDGFINDLQSTVLSSDYVQYHPPSNAFDNNLKTEWIADLPKTAKNSVWMKILFRKPETISEIKLLGREDSSLNSSQDIKIITSDGQRQNKILSDSNGWQKIKIKAAKTDWVQLLFSTETGFREINFLDSNGNQVEIGLPTIEKLSRKLYLNKDYFPRAFFVYQYQLFKNKEDLYQAILKDKDGSQMKQTVFLTQKPLRFANQKSISEESIVKIKEYGLQKVVLEANAKADGFLVLADVWYPGWTVKVDGQKSFIYQAYSTLRAVQLSQGNHEIVFSYEPKSFMLGLIITTVTILMLAVYFFSCIIYKVKSPR